MRAMPKPSRTILTQHTDSPDKESLRAELRSRRAELVHEYPDFARDVTEHVAALKIPDDSVVGGYIAIGDEADPHILLKKLTLQNCTLAFPRVSAKDEPLVFHRWTPGQNLQRGTHGIPEPSKDWPQQLERTARLLIEHIFREQDGLFPAALATLEPEEWDTVDRVRADASEPVHTEVSVPR